MTTYQGQETSLVALLLKEGLITLEQGEQVEDMAYGTGLHVGEVLVREGYITEKEIARFLTIQFQKPFVRVSHYDIEDDVLSLLPPTLYFEHKFLPMDKFDDILLVASAGILSDDVIEQIYTLTRCDVEVYISLFSEIEQKFSAVYSDDVINESLGAQRERARETGRVSNAREAELPPEVANFFDSVASQAFSSQSVESPVMVSSPEMSGVLPPDVLNFFDTCESASITLDTQSVGAVATPRERGGAKSPELTSELPPDVMNFFDTCETRQQTEPTAPAENSQANTGPLPSDIVEFFDTASGVVDKSHQQQAAPVRNAMHGDDVSAGLPSDVLDFFDTGGSGQQEAVGAVTAGDSLPDDVAGFFDTASGKVEKKKKKKKKKKGKPPSTGTASMPADVINFFESAEVDVASKDGKSAELPADVLNFFDTNTQATPSEIKKKKKVKAPKSSKVRTKSKKSSSKSKKSSKKKAGDTQQALSFFESSEHETVPPTRRTELSNKEPGESAELFIDAASTSELPADVLDFFDTCETPEDKS